MSEHVRLTLDALESFLVELDHDAFVEFVADLRRREGWKTDRDGSHITASIPDGEDRRILVWTDERSRIERLGRRQADTPEATPTDAVVTRERDASTAALLADERDAQLIETADLHDRLLYAIDRDACRDLCRKHFGRDVDPVPDPEDPSGGGAAMVPPPLKRLSVVVALCVVVLAVVVGFPGITLPGDRTADTGDPIGASVPGTAVVTPVGAVGGTTPSQTPATPQPTRTPVCTDCPPILYQSYGRLRTVSAGDTVTIEGSVSDASVPTNVTAGRITLEPPPAWNVTALVLGFEGNRYPTVDATTVGVRGVGSLLTNVGGSEPPVINIARGDWSTTWNVSIPRSVEGGRYNVSMTSEYRTGGRRARARHTVTVAVKPAGCREPCGLLSEGANGTREFDPPGPSAVENASETVRGVLYNPHPYNLTNGTVRLAPDRPNWTLTAVNGTSFDTLAPGESRPITWILRYDGPPSKYPPPNLYAGTVTYTRENGRRVTVPVTYTGEVFPPFLS